MVYQLTNYIDIQYFVSVYEKAIVKHVKKDDWYMWAHMSKGGITLPMFTSLDAYWPGIQVQLLYPTQRVAEEIIFLTHPSVSQSVCQSVRQSLFSC